MESQTQQQECDLERFIKAQEEMYPVALREIRSGMKASHWMWFIFPQLKALGFSSTAQYYGIADLAGANVYLEHPLLQTRLIEISKALLALEDSNPTRVMGYPDDLKHCSSITLFEASAPPSPSSTKFSKNSTPANEIITRLSFYNTRETGAIAVTMRDTKTLELQF